MGVESLYRLVMLKVWTSLSDAPVRYTRTFPRERGPGAASPAICALDVDGNAAAVMAVQSVRPAHRRALLYMSLVCSPCVGL